MTISAIFFLRVSCWLLVLAPCLAGEVAEAREADLATIENGKLKVGVRRDAGACVAFLAGVSGRNLLDAWDHGRFIQQSYYGDRDGSLWNGLPWRYNPVQGGDWKGNPATLIELKIEGTKLYSKTRPRQWASGADVPEMVMEQWLTLHDDVLHLRARMVYSGTQTHAPQHQEIPAVFVQKEYATLVTGEPGVGRRWQPGWPNEKVTLPEHWAAWVNAEDRGLGIFVPATKEATCYRFGDGKEKSSCSYIAPLVTFALTPGKVFEYEAWFTTGKLEEIRTRFAVLRETLEGRKR